MYLSFKLEWVRLHEENKDLIVKFKCSRFCLSLEVVVGYIQYMDDRLGLYKDRLKLSCHALLEKSQGGRGR